MSDKKILDVGNFLKEFKKIASWKRGIYLTPREESLKSLAELGLTKKNLKEIIMTLSVMDYCEGPKRDSDWSGQIWIFGKQIGGKEIYMKLKVAQVSGKKIAKCISFHPAVSPLCYPFQISKKKEDS